MKRLLIAMGWIALGITATVGLLWLFQRSMIYLPSTSVPEPPPGVEEISIATDDGLHLEAWLIPVDDARATVIVFNGNAGNRSHRLPLGMRLAEEGFAVVLTDYRGYGGNPGSPTEDALIADAKSTLTVIAERTSTKPIVYFGESLGAGVAIGLASESPPQALILRSPFASLPEVASVHYPWLPVSMLLRDRYPNVDKIPQVDSPVLIVAGTSDRIVPLDQSIRVHEAASGQKSLLTIDADHNDRALLDGEEMISGIMDFLDDTLGLPDT